MPAFTEILRELSSEKFNEVLSVSARRSRETYFHRHGIRAPKPKGRLPKAGEKNELRTAELFKVLKTVEDDEMADEILRTYLLTKRPMLAAALDHLGIPNEDGITESDDIKKFEDLSVEELRPLIERLAAVADREDVGIYLKYMGSKNVAEAMA